ncbi:tRNA preQ1(34) S-adenosylmethionine ribosyltransferase-isomerase QueA [Ruficoccus sp. ZRK36]|uniref:tRNA preQ1(34) S-adenosylmethionine ribosyltransferase-isomerase QueA n=1 Tax=Ruficoccus sp. ZRK36 TaxID=2866311 RepID=UPI001C72CEFB|nr:tRNA preQ1(34) S-adenosylmethionine ribosyltransferase-isomerase QueA [Ruficoccus sp. ZRK36]QYY34745.1 tRNA preQ1(34) S-adenosylmethionine ribosyltransferase-isomerase QueA [Ruficoccus sp. ZRK36]
MNTDVFDYPLPPELIAQVPAQQRDESRLMVVNRTTREVTHTVFRELPKHLPTGTRFFRNSASVFKARLRGQRVTGGAVECLLLHPDRDKDRFWCLLKPGKKLQPGSTFSGPGYLAEVLDVKPTGERLVHFSVEGVDKNVIALTDRIGEVPLPPYIERSREADPSLRQLDETRYQTVYADPSHKVAAAAPTAGLHFTPELLATVVRDGARFYDVRLHVGLDTFQPIKAERIEDHLIHREIYEIPPQARQALANKADGPRIAVGTTSLRACEDYTRKAPAGADLSETYVGEADLFVYPPAVCSSAEGLITNFHLPRSTLLCLVSAFLTPGSTDGIKWLKELYAEAIAMEYRFYSYGDAMLILG